MMNDHQENNTIYHVRNREGHINTQNTSEYMIMSVRGREGIQQCDLSTTFSTTKFHMASSDSEVGPTP